jgi:hypothetical protein
MKLTLPEAQVFLKTSLPEAKPGFGNRPKVVTCPDTMHPGRLRV